MVQQLGIDEFGDVGMVEWFRDGFVEFWEGGQRERREEASQMKTEMVMELDVASG